MANVLGRIVAPHFVAGIECRDGRVVWAAPIVRYMIGWSEDHVRAYVAKRGWSATRHRSYTGT
jgi:hypothetical protein